jgi:hypothetical protein
MRLRLMLTGTFRVMLIVVLIVPTGSSASRRVRATPRPRQAAGPRPGIPVRVSCLEAPTAHRCESDHDPDRDTPPPHTSCPPSVNRRLSG